MKDLSSSDTQSSQPTNPNLVTTDPYVVRAGSAHEPPKKFVQRLGYLGPGLIVTAAVIGSGELVLTTSLGAVAGWSLLWWLLLSCWCKSLVQAELARYVIASGDTYYRAMNRVPGRIWRISWPIWLGLLAYIPGTMGLGGIMGGAGQAASFLTSLFGISLNEKVGTALIAVAAAALLSTGSYRWLERALLPMVVAFTFTTLVCSIAMQFTEYRVSLSAAAVGLVPSWELFVPFAALALSAYGYTGTTAGDINHYTYWCIEKGYPSFLGSDRDNPDWERRARGWMRVLHTDVWLAVGIVTCATVPYYILGAGVLNRMGLEPQGSAETIAALSNIFTQTVGAWAVWLFTIGAFAILFSTVVSGIGGAARSIPDYLIEMQFIDRSNVALRQKIIRWYAGLLPLIAFGLYLFVPNFVTLIMIGGLTSALLLPMQAGATLYLHKRHMDARIQPRMLTRWLLWVVFGFEFLMALFVIWFVVLARYTQA